MNKNWKLEIKNWQPAEALALPKPSAKRRSAQAGKFRRSLSGFTFVEMVISFTLFTMLMTVASSVFITVSKNYNFFSGYLNGLSNLRFVLERTSREVKEGYDYAVPAAGQFTFINKDTENVTYYLDADGRIYREVQGTSLPITDERLRVEKFDPILACPNGSGCQPVVTFVLKLAPRTEAQPQYGFTLQFSVTQRRLAI